MRFECPFNAVPSIRAYLMAYESRGIPPSLFSVWLSSSPVCAVARSMERGSRMQPWPWEGGAEVGPGGIPIHPHPQNKGYHGAWQFKLIQPTSESLRTGEVGVGWYLRRSTPPFPSASGLYGYFHASLGDRQSSGNGNRTVTPSDDNIGITPLIWLAHPPAMHGVLRMSKRSARH
jgi:hypothetical protein